MKITMGRGIEPQRSDYQTYALARQHYYKIKIKASQGYVKQLGNLIYRVCHLFYL
jgi:hypothetical protein